MQETVRVDLADVTGMPSRRGSGSITEVTAETTAMDDDLAIGSDTDVDMSEWPADAAGTVRARRVQADDGAAFREAVALVDRDANLCGTLQQAW